MRLAAALAGVLVVARALGLAGRDLPLSPWLPSVLLWQDLAVALVFWLLVGRRDGSRVAPVIYWALVLWAAVNLPVVRALSSPLTLPMLRAGGGALGDSVAYYATPGMLAMVATVVAAGLVLPRVPLPRRAGGVALAAVCAVALPGPFLESRLDVRGAQRNAVSALLLSALPRAPARAVDGATDWRGSPFEGGPVDDLDGLRGAVAGRNVVMVVLESTAARYLRTYGADDDPMPTLTALARNGLQFDAAYAVYPESIKGLDAVLCSRHPGFDVGVGAHAAAPCDSLAGRLGRAGYQTALFHSGRFSYLGMETLLSRHPFDVREDAGVIGGEIESSFGVDEPSTVARMLGWIDGRDAFRPFFLVYLPIAGHHPYATPEPGPFAGEGALGDYKNALWYADRALASLLDGLRSRGLEGETVTVVFGDHGEAFGQHDGNFGHTLFAWDENVRVPLVVSGSGVIGPARARQVASVVDVAPTILDLVGEAVPAGYEGASLLTGPPRMAFVFTDYALGWAGLRDGCWKYLLEIEADRSRLFDVCRDPDETRDLSGPHEPRVEAYRARMLDWLSATRQTYQAVTDP
jgi:hypothetical protein